MHSRQESWFGRRGQEGVNRMRSEAAGKCGSGTAPSSSTDPVFGGKRVHFIGIGGSGMSGLAQLLQRRGARVSGTDQSWSEVLDRLGGDGITVSVDVQPTELPACDLVVASAAVKDHHPLLQAARRRGVEVLNYAQALGRVMIGRTGISIAGTHGKSTTTGMLAHVLITAGVDPSFIVGATCNQIGGGSRVGTERIPAGSLAGAPGVMVAEACEYNRSFHSHRPTLALINNIEEDHLDFYTGGLDEIIASFNAFAARLPDRTQGGRLLIAHDGAHRRRVTAGLSCAVSSFGFAALADYRVQFDAESRECSVSHRGSELLRWTSRLLGDHNVLNSAAAGILATWVGAERARIEEGLSSFGGVDRRLQHMGDRVLAIGGTVRVYDDYGHHPTEVDATLRAIRAGLAPTRLVCVFQPHQHSRTRHLLDEFAQSFGHADIVLVPDIYFVRDSAEDAQSVSSGDLVAKLRERGAQAWHIPSFEGIVDRLDQIAQDGDLVVVMGAGPVWEIGRDWLARSAASASGTTP